MPTVLAEGDAITLCALYATDFAAKCSCNGRNGTLLSGAVSMSGVKQPDAAANEGDGVCNYAQG